jgi:hypothetical protein
MYGVHSLGQMPSVAHPADESAEDVRRYFATLKTAGRINPLTFEDKWNALEHQALSVSDCADILDSIARILDKTRDQDLSDKVKARMLRNWDAWQDPTLLAIDEEGARNLDPADLVKIMEALRTLKIKPTFAFIGLFNQTLGAVSGKFRPGDCLKIFTAAANLGIQPAPGVKKQMLHKIKTMGASMQADMKIKLIWSCAMLDSIFGGADYKTLAEAAKATLPKETKGIAQQKQRYDSDLWFDWEASCKNPVERKTTRSKTERYFQNFIQDMGVSTNSKAHPIEKLPQAVDFAVYPAGNYVCVEVDGPDHYMSEADKGSEGLNSALNGTTRFRSALMHKVAPDLSIVRIKDSTCAMITGVCDKHQHSLETRQSMARAFLATSIKAGAGVHQFEMGRANGRYRIGTRSVLAQPRTAVS